MMAAAVRRCALRYRGLALLGAALLPAALEAQTVTYHLETGGSAGVTARFSDMQLGVVEKLNRADRRALPRLSQLVVPDQWPSDELAYSPMPRRYEAAAALSKALIVSLPQQVFGAYERGELVRWGPLSSGAEGSTTPPGLFHLNWRAIGRVSTVDPGWYLSWYFNFDNLEGRAFHQYDLPGTAASHGCIRLLERDARWLYEWGEEWQLDARGVTVVVPGTTVLVVGSYDFRALPPWRSVKTLNEPLALPAVVAGK